MDIRETKIPIYVAIIVALILIAAGGYFILESSDNPSRSSTSTYDKLDNGWTYIHSLPLGKVGIYKFEDTNGIVCYYAKDNYDSHTGYDSYTGSLSCLAVNK